MNPVKQIGRYQLPILNVVSINLRTGWRKWLKRGYDVHLVNGQVIHFTENERRQYNEAMEEHSIILQVWGMAKSAGLRA